jgi:hypothetical protein
MNGNNQSWQYQPPGQPPGGVYYPQPPRGRSTATLWWFLAAAFAVTIFITLAVVIHSVGTGPAAPTAPPVDQASYQAGYKMGQWWMTEWTPSDGGNHAWTVVSGVVTNP